MTNPLKGVALLNKFKDGSSYRIICDCTNSEHDIDAYIDVYPDADCRYFELSFNGTPVKINGFFARVTAAVKLLLTGRTQNSLEIMLSDEACLNLINSLQNDINQMTDKH